MKKLLLLLVVTVLLVSWWLWRRGSAPPEVPFAKVKRDRLVSTLVTNGKVEPVEWVAVRAERAGLVEQVFMERGQRVVKGAPIAAFSAQEAKTDLATAEARIAQAQAELELLERGGRPAELAAIDGDLVRMRLDLGAAHKDLGTLERLAAKGAATRQEVLDATHRVESEKAQIHSLEGRRAALVSRADRTLAQAKLQEAEAAAKLARLRIEQAVVRAPMPGLVYDLAARAGSYLNPGDRVADIGQIEQVRVRVYVDEPELGRVTTGLPVLITWDALPGRKWQGAVERTPTEIKELGTRQVGEVVCIIGNPGRELLPGTNINAEIVSQAVENALTIPKEALRRASEEAGVFVLRGNHIAWRKVSLGVSSITRVQVLQGLAEGDAVTLPSELALSEGLTVSPVYP